jgi:hypothetical protein
MERIYQTDTPSSFNKNVFCCLSWLRTHLRGCGVLQNCTALLTDERGLCSEISQPPSAETHEVVSIKAEDMEVKEEIAVPVSFDWVNSEQSEVSHLSLYPLLGTAHTLPLSRSSCSICHISVLSMMEIPRKCTHVKVFSCVLFTPTCFCHCYDLSSGWHLTRIQLL